MSDFGGQSENVWESTVTHDPCYFRLDTSSFPVDIYVCVGSTLTTGEEIKSRN